jgi:hypothetical protein
MGLKGTKIYSILTMTCPRCQEGELFIKKSAYSKGMTEMHKRCPNCGEPFEREPGFYYGAAYVSYGLTVALWIAVLVALIVFDAIGLISFSFMENPILYLSIGIGLLLVLLPVLYRLSRAIWINFFVKYREDAIEFNKAREIEKAEKRKKRKAEADQAND